MKRINIALIIVISVISLLLTSCVTTNTLNAKETIPTEIVERIKNNRNISKYNHSEKMKEFETMLYKYENFDDELAPENIATKKEEIVNTISPSEAIEDVEYMFNVLKYTYPGYEYFGGDKTFLSAKDKTLNNLSSFNEEITVDTLFNTITSNMDFIQDGHFYIYTDNNSYCPNKEYYYLNNEDIQINKDGNRFYTINGNEKYYIDSIDGDKNIDDYIKPTLSQDGSIVYNLGITCPDKYKSVDVIFKSSKKTITKNISLLYKFPKQMENVGYGKYQVDGISIVKNRRMLPISYDDKTHDELDDFVESAKELKNEEIFILDIRNNLGGSSIYPMDWYENFTDKEPSSENFFAKLNTRTIYNLFLNIENKGDIPNHELSDEVKSKLSGKEKKLVNGAWYTGYCTENRFDNEPLVIVLINNNVASAGEEFVSYLRTLNNVLFIGTNSSGTVLIGSNTSWFLPNSNIAINSGTNINLPPTMENIDGKGFYPDLWVNSEDIVNRVINFINKYDLSDINIGGTVNEK